MDCTEPRPVSRGLAVLSPVANLLAGANGNVLEILSVMSNDVVQQVTTAGPITHITWSVASPALVAAVSASGDIVIADENGEVVADVHGGRLRTIWIALGSDGRLLVGYEHSLGVAVFDCFNAQMLTFISAAGRATKGQIVSPCGQFATFVSRDARYSNDDTILIVALSDARVVGRVRAPGGISLVIGIRWMNDALLIWGRRAPGSPADCSAMISVHGTVLGSDITVPHIATTADAGSEEYGEDMNEETEEASPALCVATIGANALVGAVACVDGSIRIIDVERSRVVAKLNHTTPDAPESALPLVFREVRRARKPAFAAIPWAPCLDVGPAPRANVGAATSPATRTAVTMLEASPSGQFLASRGASAPHVVLIWDTTKVRLAAVLILRDEVVTMRWNNALDGQPTLALACGGPAVYLWQMRGAAAIRVGTFQNTDERDFDEAAAEESLQDHEDDENEIAIDFPFGVRKITWSHDDSALLLVDGLTARAFVTMYIT